MKVILAGVAVVMLNFTLSVILVGSGLLLVSCESQRDIKHTVFGLGFKSDSVSTGPLINSGYLYKLDESAPPLFLTAHHVVAGYGQNKYYPWFEIKDKVKNVWLWSMHDSNYEIGVAENIPIPGAETLKLDLAAFMVQAKSGMACLEQSHDPAKVGDTILLFTKLRYTGNSTLYTPSKVTYATDSILVYELITPQLIRMSGTSGAPLINREHKLVGSSFGGLTIPNAEIKKELGKEFPLIDKLNIEIGKTYGIAIPVSLVHESLLNAIGAQATND